MIEYLHETTHTLTHTDHTTYTTLEETMITVTVVTLIAYILYRKSNSNAILTALSAAAVVVLLAALGHRGLPVQAYVLSWVVMWVGIQVITPLAEGRWPSMWIGNRCLTFTVITVGV